MIGIWLLSLFDFVHSFTCPVDDQCVASVALALSTCSGQEVVQPGNCWTCYDLKKKYPDLKTGAYLLQLWDPSQKEHMSVRALCDMERGGRTVIMQRLDGSVMFNQTWAIYKAGFGRLKEAGAKSEHWLGLDALHLLSSSCGPQQLRVDLSDCDGNTAYEEYSRFQIGDESTYYAASVGGATGTAGDGLNNGQVNGSTGVPGFIDGMAFTTTDRDHDKNIQHNCASRGWWWNDCFYTTPTGQYDSTCLAYGGI